MKFTKKIKRTISDVLEELDDVVFGKDDDNEMIFFDEIVNWAKEKRKEYPEAVAFLIAVKDNPNCRNDKDKLLITQGLLDINNKPISLYGREPVGRILYTKTIDEKLINALNGEENVIVKF